MPLTLIPVVTAVTLACAEPFPPDRESGWIEARTPCTLSHDHDLTYIRVWTDEAAFGPYLRHDAPYPAGATLLKGMYRDERCEELHGWVTMVKLAEGSDPENHDWEWRRFRADGSELEDPRRIPYSCIDCHVWHCAELPYGWDLTCNRDGPEPEGPPP